MNSFRNFDQFLSADSECITSISHSQNLLTHSQNYSVLVRIWTESMGIAIVRAVLVKVDLLHSEFTDP